MRTRSQRQQHGSLPRAAARRGIVLGLVAALVVIWVVGPGAGGWGGVSTAVVSGDSMEPTLHDGDLAVLRHDGSPSTGDLVLFDLGGGWVVHRLAAGDPETGWSTRGDGNDFTDRWVVHADDVRGRYWFSLPGVGHAVLWLRSHAMAIGALIASPFLVGFLPGRKERRIRSTERPLVHPAAVDWLLPAELLAALALLVAVVVHRTTRGEDAWPWTALAGAATVVTGAAMWRSGRAVLRGGRRPEPVRSLWALDGVLVAVDAVPEGIDSATPVPSAPALRDLAEELGAPVLHHVSTDGAWHLFVVQSDGRSWVWSPLPAAEVAERAHTIDPPPSPVADGLPESLRAANHRLPDRRPVDRGRRGRHHRRPVARRVDAQQDVGAA